jgi:rfaE bifunctional protein kinase chain/domain
MNKSRFNKILDKFPSLHLLVVGDFFLDKYLTIDPALSETSLETGLEAYQVVEIRHSPGAAGTVVANLRTMEVRVSVVGLTGLDGEGFDLRQDLQQLGVNISGLLETQDRFTPTYTKPMLRAPGGPERELNRLDIKNRQPLPPRHELAVMAELERLVPEVDGIIVADQVQEENCGVITARMRTKLAGLAQAYPAKPMVADSRVHIGQFEGIMIKPNLHEAKAAVAAAPEEIDPLKAARRCGAALFEKNRQPVFVTLGKEGILAVSQAGLDHVPGISVSGPIDIVGAGDSVMAGLTAALAAGATVKEAAFIGNMAASITIQQLGTTGTASRSQLRDRFAEINET